MAKAEEKTQDPVVADDTAEEKGLDIGYGRYRGKPIVAVSMELQRRVDAIDEVLETSDEFLFIGRARVDKHVYDPQQSGVHMVVKAAAVEMFKITETEGRKLLNKKRDQQKQVDKAIEERKALVEEADAGIVRLPLGSGENDDDGEGEDLPIGDPE